MLHKDAPHSFTRHPETMQLETGEIQPRMVDVKGKK
jgi:hypothetical protein